METESGSVREWMYLDKISAVAPQTDSLSQMNNTQPQLGSTMFQPKGPFTTAILLRLLEKGLGISADTLIWKTGMIEWQKISLVEPFKGKSEFLSGK